MNHDRTSPHTQKESPSRSPGPCSPCSARSGERGARTVPEPCLTNANERQQPPPTCGISKTRRSAIDRNDLDTVGVIRRRRTSRRSPAGRRKRAGRARSHLCGFPIGHQPARQPGFVQRTPGQAETSPCALKPPHPMRPTATIIGDAVLAQLHPLPPQQPRAEPPDEQGTFARRLHGCRAITRQNFGEGPRTTLRHALRSITTAPAEPWVLGGCSDAAERPVTRRHDPAPEPAKSRTNRHEPTLTAPI
jgi:hypothetical protein